MTLALSMEMAVSADRPSGVRAGAGTALPSIESLAAQAQGGSERAFEALVREAGPRVLRFLSRRLRDEHLAEDLTQEALLSVHRALGSYDPRRPFLPWMFTIAIRLATDAQRSRSASLRREKAVATREVMPPPAAWDEGDVWGAARAALSPGEYAAVWMRYAEEFDIPDVASAIGKSGVATRVMLLRARRKLEKALAKEMLV